MSPSPSRRLRILIALVSAFTIVFGPAMSLVGIGLQQAVAGTATVDGRVTAGDGYTKFADIHVDGDAVATVWWTRDDDFVYFALELNALAEENVVNENVYAPSPGNDYHGASAFDTGWNNHTFGHLLGSDAARFQIACNGVVKDDFIHDYLYETTSGYASGPAGPDGEIFTNGPIATSSSMVWNSTVGWANFETQSPDFEPKYPTPAASTPTNWVWEMTYEFKLNAANYQGCLVSFAMPAFSGETGEIGGMHNSPAKEGGESIIVTPIPEPTEPDLSITKSASVDEIVVGGSYTYLLTVTNDGDGDGDATNVTVTDNLHDELDVDSVTPSQGSCDTVGLGNTVSCDLGTLAADGGSATIRIVVTTTVASCGEVTNQASADAGNNGEATSELVSVDVLCPDVSVVKTASPASVDSGESGTFTIVVTAGGTGDSENVSLTDTLPNSGLTWTVGGADIESCEVDETALTAGDEVAGGSLLSCDFGTMLNGTSRTITLTATLTAGHCPGISNTAFVEADVDVDPNDNDWTAQMAVNCPDLSVTKSASVDEITVGGSYNYLITVTNNGDGDATDVVVTDDLDDDLVVDSVTPSQGSCDAVGLGNTLSCNVGTLAADGGSATISIAVTTTVASCGEVANRAFADAGNNGEAESLPVSVDVLCPDVSVLKTADEASVNAGDPVGYQIVVTAGGTGTSENVEFEDQLPAGITWTAEIVDPDADDSCSISLAKLLECSFGEVAAGSTKTVNLSGTAAPGVCPGIENSAEVTADVDVDSSDNDFGPVEMAVNCPDVKVTKSGSGTVNATDAIWFELLVENIGDGDAYDFELTDTLPAVVGGWSEGSGFPSFCGLAGNNLTCELEVFGSGDDFTVRVEATSTVDDCGELPNTAEVSADNEHADNTANNESSATIMVECPALTPVKTADDDLVSAGQSIGFGITISNADESDTGVAYDVEINDPLPAGPGIDWEIDSDPAAACEITGSVGSEVLECAFGDLDPGDSVSVHVSSDTTAASCERYENVASITSDNHETLEPKDDTLVQCPGLNILKDADADQVVAGETASFLIKIWNTGPGDALDVVWTDETPAGLSWSVEVVQGTAESCIGAATPEGESWQCELGDLAVAEGPDDEEAVHIRISAETSTDDCGALENTAFADASNDDEVSSGDTITVRCPQLVIDKVADVEVVTITTTDGEVSDIDPEVVTWTLTYTLTDGPVTGAVITDEVPEFLDYVDGSASSGGVYDEATRTITWSLGTLTSGGVVTFQTTVDADAPEGPAIENVAVIDSNETEPDDGRDSITVVSQQVLGPTPTPKPTTPPDTATAAQPSGAPVQLPLAVLVILFAGSLGAFATASIRVARRQD